MRRHAASPFPLLAAAAAAVLALARPVPSVAQDGPAPEPAVLQKLASFEDTYIGRPSVSPDGRWIVFGKAERSDVQNLWIMPAGGGQAVRLTSGDYWEEDPVWSPDGSLLVFASNRAARSNASQFFLMRLPLDPATGRPAGPPRQLSVEPVQVEPAAVSPDGRSVAYVNGETPRRLQVIPIEGGVARTLAERPRYIFNPTWAEDGRAVHFTAWGEDRRHELWRVAADGGQATRLAAFPDRTIRPLSSSRLVSQPTGGGPGARRRVLEVADLGGRVLQRIDVDAGVRPTHFTPDGRGLLAMTHEVDAPIRLVPLAGGGSRDVTPGTEYDWPIGWTADGSLLATTTLPSGRAAVVIIAPDGTHRRTIELPRDVVGGAWGTMTGESILYTIRDRDQPDVYRLVMQRLSDGREFELRRGGRVPGPLTGRGGAYDADGPDLLFTERKGGRLHHYAASPDGEVRLLRSLDDRAPDNPLLGVHGERIAMVERRGDELHVKVAENASAPFRTVSRIPDPGSDTRVEIVWDHAGRRLAVPFYPGPEDDRYAVAFIDVPAQGAEPATPVIAETGALWGYEARWLPDGSGITLLVQRTGGHQTDVIFLPARAGAEPTVLTESDPATMWGQTVSPDGRWVAYPAEIPRGSGIVRIELADPPRER